MQDRVHDVVVDAHAQILQHREALRDFVADPSPGVLLVTGPPGIGKSFLLRRFADEAKHSP